MGDKKSGPLYNYNSFSSYNVKAGGSKNSPKGFSLRSGNNPSVSELSGISPIKDKFVKVGEKGGKKGVGPFTEKQDMRSEGLDLIHGGMKIGGAVGDAMFDEGDRLVTESRKGSTLDYIIKNSTVGGKELK